MPVVQGQIRGEELPEFPVSGPFAGILSEVPQDALELFGGFVDCNNVVLRKGMIYTRPPWTALPPLPAPQNEPIYGIADFFDKFGVRHQVVITTRRMIEWSAQTQTWTIINGVLNGTPTPYAVTVCANQLLFSQGLDTIQSWDGILPAFGPVSPNAPVAKFVAEIGGRLVAAYTTFGGVVQPQGIAWTNTGDPSDWLSFGSGQGNLFNSLGPITGLIKTGQILLAIQQWGLTRLIPTGLGLRPFDIVPFASHKRGGIFPRSVAGYGEDLAVYVGKDNVYMVNENGQSETIGDFPVSGQRIHLGARTRIFAELANVADSDSVVGYVTTSIGGTPYNAYWLVIPNGSVWVFNFDELSWTRFTFAEGRMVGALGQFNNPQPIRIIDLVGQIRNQAWSPATLQGDSTLDSFLLGFTDGVAGLVDFTGVSEQDWAFEFGSMTFKDHRHEKTIKKIRLVFEDDFVGTEVNITVTNEKGQTETRTLSNLGTSTGQPMTRVVAFNLPGIYKNVRVHGEAGNGIVVSEIAPMYQDGGEIKGAQAS